MSIFVFLGPSLKLEEAKLILPNAYYMPPAGCGDIVRIIDLKPTVIILIDGYFENQPSVWHKEILYALSKGIAVYGAASMGALRAAELVGFGMVGIGAIYSKYKTKEIIDDDEVALLHLPESENFKPCTLAMVDIRATIEYAVLCKVINSVIAQNILNIAKQIFYQQRTEDAWKSKCGQLERVSIFFKWIRENYVSQKALDAKLVLKTVRENAVQTPYISTFNFSNTALFRNLKIESLSTPFPFFQQWLPTYAKINGLSQLFDEYSITNQLAKALGVAHDCGFISIEDQVVTFVGGSPDSIMVEKVLDYLIKFSATVTKNDIEKTSLNILSQITVVLYGAFNKHFYEIKPAAIGEIVQQFCLKKKINTQDEFIQWLDNMNMKIEDFKFASSIVYFFDYFITQNNLATFVNSKNTDIYNYLYIALSLNGLDKKIIEDIALNKATIIGNNLAKLTLQGDNYAIMHGFANAFEMRNFIDKVSNLNISSLNTSSLMSWRLLQVK